MSPVLSPKTMQFYRGQFQPRPLSHFQEPIKDHQLATLSKLSLGLLVALVMVKTGLGFLVPQIDFKVTYIALAAAPILLFSR